jgi:hypothetical protein
MEVDIIYVGLAVLSAVFFFVLWLLAQRKIGEQDFKLRMARTEKETLESRLTQVCAKVAKFEKGDFESIYKALLSSYKSECYIAENRQNGYQYHAGEAARLKALATAVYRLAEAGGADTKAWNCEMPEPEKKKDSHKKKKR